MRLFRTVLALGAFALSVLAQDGKEKHAYQSDVARLRKIVINSLYSHRDVFLRELISNANDALEKLRLTSLTEPESLSGAEQMNVTIKAYKDSDGAGRLVITDTGIGMTPDELTKNLGTLAKSGTSDFLSRAEGDTTSGTGNLIGAFGLGFYSSFLVADRVEVASTAAKTSKNLEPAQYVFASGVDENSFDIYPDPRGNTLGRGTEITLHLKGDAVEYLDTKMITDLVNKHSSFSTSFPIYLYTQKTEYVPDEEAEAEAAAEKEKAKTEDADLDEDEAVVEEVTEEAPEEVKTKAILVDDWVRLNSQPPIWTRDPKEITDEEYENFYMATYKDFEKPLAWYHFAGDSGSGVSFRAIVFVPSRLDDAYWQNPLESTSKDIRLMVKRVFITSDLGEDTLPKWANWVKVVVDAEDLPLNVSRETLQSNAFLKQLRGIIIKRLLQLLGRIQTEGGEKWDKLQEVYGNVFKLGAVEDMKNRDKLGALVRFPTNQRNSTSLDEYLENKKQGQNQIFYLADMGKLTHDLAKSVFIEKLHARGYEVLLLGDPLDEVFITNVRRWKKIGFQDVAKAGLKFGDENIDEEEKAEREMFTEKYKPLIEWLRKEVRGKSSARDIVISNRLVISSCAIVADESGYTANLEKLISSSHAQANHKHMWEFAKKQKVLEINPRSPTIEGLLRRIEQLPTEEEERDLEAEEELREVASVLVDGALVRSGFAVTDSNDFFMRVDRILRRSLGVSEDAPTDTNVKPAPPVDPELPPDADVPEEDEFLRTGRGKISWEVEEVDEFGNVVKEVPVETKPHDEL
ncbi:heat shock protein Hsp90 [Epithele typhae]|uniref:heat shock protein Hsp90 n=1 Tax=Epithele typhae TaxID=378194 RepID=UPI002007EC72|nr:heat shock protein Hsp90 [Epithele typhae]KAH9918203.1 heat shock protein Hsp90 [Epithele typhae]